jgi:hypothetical protein
MKAFRSLLAPLVALVVAAQLHAAPIISTATFQQDTAGYSGTFDRKIGPMAANEVNGSAVNTDTTSYFIDGGASALNDDGATHGLVRFDNIVGAGGVPANATVVSATVDVITGSTSNAQSGGAYNLYRLSTSFNSTSSWATDFGGDGLAGNVSAILGSFDGMNAVGNPASARADNAVQAWVNGAANLGFGVRSDRSTDGWSPHTTGSATIASRPKLTVNYTTDPRVVVGQYSSSADSFPNGNGGGSVGTIVDGSTVTEGFVDGDNGTDSFDQPYLVRFNNLDLNFAQITKAELIFVSGFGSANADSPEPWTIHRMLQDWSVATTYASLDKDGNPLLTNPAELVTGGVIAPSAYTLPNANDTEVVHLDVTPIVESWRTGAANYGFFVGAGPTSTNGWQFFTSGAADASFRPTLRIVGVRIPEPASALLTMFGGALAAASTYRNRRRQRPARVVFRLQPVRVT